jgi:acetylornithine deacetylase/succinyl-diaminopimelate desuccinylase-like protein
MKIFCCSVLFSLCLAGLGPAAFILPAALATQPGSGGSVTTLDEIKSEFKSVPCNNQDREQAASALLERLGAPHDAITVQHYKNSGGVDDIVVIKQGASDDKIVIGAHYDKVIDGCGAIDNWTGVVTVAYLYRAFKDRSPNKTLVFVLFGKEESGLIGSAAMVSAIEKANLQQYCAMVNIDSLGLAAPQVPDNMSVKKLQSLAEVIARNMKMSFGHAAIPGAGADSMSFANRNIPALTIHGLTPDWRSILHTRCDQVAKVDPRGVYLGYLFALNLISSIDNAGCDSFR